MTRTEPIPSHGAAPALLPPVTPPPPRRPVRLPTLPGSLTDAWGTAGAFPRLVLLSALSNSLTGPLPDTWAQPGAFPVLSDLVLISNELSGPLPPSWGSASAWNNLTGGMRGAAKGRGLRLVEYGSGEFAERGGVAALLGEPLLLPAV